MSYAVTTTPRFERLVRKFRRDHPELQGRLARVLRDLATDPHQPRLDLHPLRGRLDGYHAVRIDYSNRIVLTIQVSEREITLHDIGSHDEVYR